MSTLLSSLLPFSKNTRRARQTSPLPTNPFSLQEPAQAKPYLTAFAPLVLTSHSNRVSASKSDSLREAHNLTFSAPPPFPPDMYKISVAYESDPETQSLVSVSTPESSGSNPSIPESLRHWLDTRSANPLLTLDVSGLCWGINRYWEAAISRAQIWTRLEAQHPKLLGKTLSIDASRKRPSLHSNGTFTRSDLRYLVSHIERSTMLFESTDKAPKLLLSCPVTIDEWTSEPQLIPEISVTASRASKKIEQESKKLFLALLHDSGEGGAQNDDIHAIVRATEGVLCSLFRS